MKVLQQVRGPGPLGHMTQQTQLYLRFQWQIGTLSGDFGRPPIGQSQRRPLGHWSKALPSSSDIYSPFEKQLLAYYWALGETERLTMGHQVTMRPKLPIMNWVLSDSTSHKVGYVQQYSIVSRSGTYVIGHGHGTQRHK